MKDLIKVTDTTINNEVVQAVSARELHQFLESKQDFSDWVKSRIDTYDFQENQDFIVFRKIMKNPTGGRPAKEYAITLDMAKELH